MTFQNYWCSSIFLHLKMIFGVLSYSLINKTPLIVWITVALSLGTPVPPSKMAVVGQAFYQEAV